MTDASDPWQSGSDIPGPVTVVLGGLSTTVSDPDVLKVQRRQPEAVFVTVADTGHSVQSAQPLVLAAIVRKHSGRA